MEVFIDARIHEIADEEFYFVNTSNVQLKDVFMQIDFGGFLVNNKEKTVYLKTAVRYIHRTDEGETVLLVYANKTEFFIDNLEELVIVNDTQNLLDKGVIRFLLNIVIHVMRGILVMKTMGTSLQKAYLPLYNAENLIK